MRTCVPYLRFYSFFVLKLDDASAKLDPNSGCNVVGEILAIIFAKFLHQVCFAHAGVSRQDNYIQPLILLNNWS